MDTKTDLNSPVVAVEQTPEQETPVRPTRRANWIWPGTIRTLVLVGFLLVSLPLLIALGSATLSVDRLADLSRKTVYQSVRNTQGSRKLINQLTDMERSFRQYLVLDDPELFNAFQQMHLDFTEELRSVSFSEVTVAQRSLKELASSEFNLFSTLIEPDTDKETLNELVEKFVPLTELARSLLRESSKMVSHDIDMLQEQANQAQERILFQTGLLIPSALLLVGFFTFLIARSVRQMDHAIRELGKGRFNAPITVIGPKDLQYLGERLDWLRNRLRELEQEKQTFIRNVSHELKTPLADIREGGELLADEVVGELNKEQHEIINILRRSAIQLQGMIENLLHYNKIQTQFTTLNPSQFGLAKLVKAVLDDHRLSMLAKSLRLDSHLQNVKMWGDEEKLRTVVDNLLSNAVKYSDKNGLIRLRLYPKHDNVFFEVANQGPSIDGKERERIFDLFYRGEAVERCNIRGTGVGLVVVREYVSLHNGQIELLEAAVEHGQQNIVFRVQLPVDCRRELG